MPPAIITADACAILCGWKVPAGCATGCIMVGLISGIVWGMG
jgi:hypothetical protein